MELLICKWNQGNLVLESILTLTNNNGIDIFLKKNQLQIPRNSKDQKEEEIE